MPLAAHMCLTSDQYKMVEALGGPNIMIVCKGRK